MPTLNNYKIFISHVWRHGEKYGRILKFLQEAENFRFSNFSIPEERKFLNLTNEELKEELKGQIRPVEVVLIVGGMHVTHSDWIEFEIDYAIEKNKPIIGIMPWSGERMPKVVKEASNVIVGWNTHSIIKAIRHHAI